jgi:hypothetical protein
MMAENRAATGTLKTKKRRLPLRITMRWGDGVLFDRDA